VYVIVCDLEPLTMRRPRPELGCYATEGKKILYCFVFTAHKFYSYLVCYRSELYFQIAHLHRKVLWWLAI
jgi:hypothetical protein